MPSPSDLTAFARLHIEITVDNTAIPEAMNPVVVKSAINVMYDPVFQTNLLIRVIQRHHIAHNSVILVFADETPLHVDETRTKMRIHYSKWEDFFQLRRHLRR